MVLSNRISPKADSAEVSLRSGSEPRRTPRNLVAVGAVMLLALAVQCWLVARTPVSSIDSVRFVSIAQSIEAEGLLSVLHSDREQPLFPLVVCGVHHALDSLGVDRTVVWMRSVQVASVLGLLLALPAIYLVARRLVGDSAALVGVAAFVLLPEVARIGPDGVADSWHLALASWAVALVFGKRERKPVFLVGAGVLIALALLVRVEAVVVIGAMLLGFLFFSRRSEPDWQACPRDRILQPLSQKSQENKQNQKSQQIAGASPAAKRDDAIAANRVACFVLGLGLVLVPYLLICGTYQPSQAVSRLLGRAASREVDRSIVNEDSLAARKHATASVAANKANKTTLAAEVSRLATFSTKEPGKSIRRRGLLPAIGKVAEETADLFGYWVGLFALAGALIVTSRKTHFEPLDRFAWLLIGLLLAVVVWFTAKEGYVTARHLLLLLIPSVGCIGVGILAFSDRMCSTFLERPTRSRTSSTAKRSFGKVIIAMVFLVMLLSHIAPHRAHRSAYREAGCWLASRSPLSSQEEGRSQGATITTGTVFDTRGWTSLFSTMPTYQAEQAKDAFADPRLEYVVVMEEELLSSSDRSRTLRELLDRGAKRVARFTSPDARRATDTLIIYRYERKTPGHKNRGYKIAKCDVVSHLACEVKKGSYR